MKKGLKALQVLLHLAGFPVLIALIVWKNWDIMTEQFKNYGIYTLVGAIVPVALMVVFYIFYFIIARKNSRVSKLSQTAALVLIGVLLFGGLWVGCDRYLPDFLSDATSGTIYYEDLAEDGWENRKDVNEKLLHDFIKLNVIAGTLPAKSEEAEVEDSVKYYEDLGIDTEIPALKDCEYYHTVNELLAIQYQSINANGYNAFTSPWISFATGGRLTIPCLVHLLLDEKTADPGCINEGSVSGTVEENADGEMEVTFIGFAYCNPETKEISLEEVEWTILDMLGTNTDFDLCDLLGVKGYTDMTDAEILASFDTPEEGQAMVESVGTFKMIEGLINSNQNMINTLSVVLADENVLGSEVFIAYKDGVASLVPATTADGDNTYAVETAVAIDTKLKEMGSDTTVVPRGSLDYQNMAWLDSNGLIYAITTLFSVRTWFIYFAAWLAIILLIDGCLRGMISDEKKRMNYAATRFGSYDPETIERPAKKGKSSFVVVDSYEDINSLNVNKMQKQLAADSENGVSRKYYGSEF